MQILIKYTNNKEIIKQVPKEVINNTTLLQFKEVLKEIEQLEQDIQYIHILPYINKRYSTYSNKVA